MELQGLNVNKAMGPDKIPARLRVECAEEIANSVFNLFNFPLSSGVFFSIWKDTNLMPLFEKGKRKFSQTTVVFTCYQFYLKCLKNVAHCLMVFTENHIYYHQHSFHESLSFTTQLLSVLHKIGNSLDCSLERRHLP